MERLTERNKKGCAYFNNDGILIRGANGTFHQKKDITAQYIHDRFVALDKVIDRLAAYEDTGLTPEEIVALIQPPNDPLTVEELREMAWKQTPVWCRDADGIHAGLLCIRDDWYTSERTPHIWILDEEGNSGVYSVQSLIQAGATFYRRRPEEETV